MTEDHTESNQTSEIPTCCGGPEEQTNSAGDSTSNRRRFLLGVGAATALVAGCVGGDDGGNGGDDGGNGGDDGGNGGDDGTDSGDDGTDSGDDGTDSGDDGTDSGDDGSSTSEQFFENFKWDSEFEAEFTNQGENNISGNMIFNDGDIYYSFDGDESQGELYFLDEGVYSVQDGDCVVLSEGQVSQPGESFSFDSAEDLEAQNPDITEVGTDTIDGDPVTEYEVDGETFYTMYVLDSGYVRRVETEEGVADYYNWGDTEPIEPPDMNCTSPGGGGDGGGGGGSGGGGGYP